MFAFLSRQSITVKVILAIVLIALLLGGFYSIQSWAYHRGHAKYIEESKAWQTERAQLLSDIAALRQERDDAKARAATYEAQAEKGKKLDESIADKVSELDKQAAAEAANTDLPADCGVRADRTCAKLASLKPPIVLDCALYKRKLCQ